MSFRIVSTGSFLPPRVVMNQELEGMMDTSDQWIRERTGVLSRHICTTETASDMGLIAAKRALESAGTKPEELDMIIAASISGAYISPGVSNLVQTGLGATCPTMDISAACSGFLFALDTAAGFFNHPHRPAKKILIVCAEQMSRLVDWTDRGTAIIFGDGAGAALLESGDNYLSSQLYTRGDFVIKIPTNIGISPFWEGEQERPLIHMRGQETFKFAVSVLAADVESVLSQAGLTTADVDHVVPHQANYRIIESAMKRLDIPAERFGVNISTTGNTSAASVPLVLDELNQAGKLVRGDIIVLSAFGGGLASAASVLRW